MYKILRNEKCFKYIYNLGNNFLARTFLKFYLPFPQFRILN